MITQNRKIKIAGVILAAGKGDRIGGNKALLKIDNTSFLETISTNLQRAQCNPTMVVCGSSASRVSEEAKRLSLDILINEDWEQGQFSSLKKALIDLHSKVDGAMVCLVDHPLVLPETYMKLVNAFSGSSDNIIQPVFNGRRGHPIILPKKIIAEVIHAEDGMTLRDIIKRHKSLAVQIGTDDPGILHDIDTVEDYKRAYNYERRR